MRARRPRPRLRRSCSPGVAESRPVAATIRGLLVAATCLAPTCERIAPVRSTDVATRDTELHLTVEGDAGSTRWEAWMLGPGGPVQLDDGDRLLLDGSPMRSIGPGAHAITTPPAIDRATLVYARGGDAEDVEVVVDLPPLTPLELPSTVGHRERLVVRWTPAPGPWVTTLRVEGSCLDAAEVRLAPGVDDGAAELPIEVSGGDGCAADVRLTRIVARDLDAPPLARAPSRIVRTTGASIVVAR